VLSLLCLAPWPVGPNWPIVVRPPQSPSDAVAAQLQFGHDATVACGCRVRLRGTWSVLGFEEKYISTFFF
jgi:hypothetical protein